MNPVTKPAQPAERRTVLDELVIPRPARTAAAMAEIMLRAVRIVAMYLLMTASSL
jgi:hypothetical protein